MAKLDGWKRKPEFDYTSHLDPVFRDYGERVEMWGKDTGQLIPFSKLPDYLNDLNAVHKVENKLSIRLPYVGWEKSEKDEYFSNLCELAGTKGCVFSTAAQRTEAILKTLGKWKDE